MDGQQNIHVKAGNSVSVNVGEGKSKLYMDKNGNVTVEGSNDISLIVSSSMIELTKEEISLSSDNIKIAGKDIDIRGKGQWQGGKIKIN